MNVSKLNSTCLLLSQKQGRVKWSNFNFKYLQKKENEIVIQQNMSIKSYFSDFMYDKKSCLANLRTPFLFHGANY